MTETLIALLSSLTLHLGGSLGCAILALSFGVRVALMPLTLRLARRMLKNQEIALTLKPEIDALKKRFEKKPEKLFEEMQKVYRKHNYKPFDLPAVLASFAQLPIFGIVYNAIKTSVQSGPAFLWIRTLASPDFLLTFAILALTGVSAYYAPSASEMAKTTLIYIQIAVTFFIVWKLAAGLGLYWAASGAVGLVQNLLLRREMLRQRQAV
jgi:YidC/Oxa1 family membrane protein insertase